MAPSPALLAGRPHAPAVVPACAPPGVRVLAMTEPLPGFPDHRDYALVPADGAGLLSWLQALAPDGPRFLVVPPAAFFPDYAPVVPAAVRAELGLAPGEDPDVRVLLTVPAGDVAGATANLRAPLVVAPGTARARQVVLSDPAHPVRRPIRR